VSLALILVHATRQLPELGHRVDQRLSLLELHLKGFGASFSGGEYQLDPFAQWRLVLTQLAQFSGADAAVPEGLRSRVVGHQPDDLPHPVVCLLPDGLLSDRLEQPLHDLSDFHSLPPPRPGVMIRPHAYRSPRGASAG